MCRPLMLLLAICGLSFTSVEHGLAAEDLGNSAVAGNPVIVPAKTAVSHVPEVDSIGETPNGDPSGQKEGTNNLAPLGSVAVFEKPCHFAIHETSSDAFGGQVVRDALVIYEGMTLEIFDNGNYRLSFVAEVPRTPVTLRLQLSLAEFETLQVNASTNAGNDEWVATKRVVSSGTITLPPFTLEPDGDLSRHQPGETKLLVREGYSHYLNRLIAANRSHVIDQLHVTRHGVARFGSIPEKGEYSILDPQKDKTPPATTPTTQPAPSPQASTTTTNPAVGR